ncbi:MAG TPA: hypothetical protein VGH40_14090 [Roseiarcus sp.]|jgi:Flp pilus assembly protein TadG
MRTEPRFPAALERAQALFEDEQATAAVETALILPIALTVLALLVYGAEGFAIDRKVTLTARTVTDLITQATPTLYSGGSSVVAAAAIDSNLQVASAVLTPYTAANMTMVVSEVLVAANGATATVQWSEPYNGASARPANQVLTLPPSLGTGQGGSYFILGEVSYTYAPLQLWTPLGTIVLSGSIYLTPRQSTSITCHNCATPD